MEVLSIMILEISWILDSREASVLQQFHNFLFHIGLFFLSSGVEVRVPEDALPSELHYMVLARDPDENDTFTASILDTVKLPRGAKLCSLSVSCERNLLFISHICLQFEIIQVLPVSFVGHF